MQRAPDTGAGERTLLQRLQAVARVVELGVQVPAVAAQEIQLVAEVGLVIRGAIGLLLVVDAALELVAT